MVDLFKVNGFKKGSLYNDLTAVSIGTKSSTSSLSGSKDDWRVVRLLSDSDKDKVMKIKGKNLRPSVRVSTDSPVSADVSAVHGTGLFANSDFKEGDVIFKDYSLLSSFGGSFFWKTAENKRCIADLYKQYLELKRRYPKRCEKYDALFFDADGDWYHDVHSAVNRLSQDGFYKTMLWKAEQLDLDKCASQSESAKLHEAFDFHEKDEIRTERISKIPSLEELMTEASSTEGLRHATRDMANMVFPNSDSGLQFDFEAVVNALCVFLANAWDDAVYEFVSRLNHSCAHNVCLVPLSAADDGCSQLPLSGKVRLDEKMLPVAKRKGVAVVAVRDIAKGQELLACYFTNPMNKFYNDMLQYQSQELRRIGLHKCHGFYCSCERCDQMRFDDCRSFRCQRGTCLPQHKGVVKWKAESYTFFGRCSNCGLSPSVKHMKLFIDMEKAIKYFMENYSYNATQSTAETHTSATDDALTSFGDAKKAQSIGIGAVKQPRALSAVMMSATGDVHAMDDEAFAAKSTESDALTTSTLRVDDSFWMSEAGDCDTVVADAMDEEKTPAEKSVCEMSTQTGADDMVVTGGLKLSDFGVGFSSVGHESFDSKPQKLESGRHVISGVEEETDVVVSGELADECGESESGAVADGSSAVDEEKVSSTGEAVAAEKTEVDAIDSEFEELFDLAHDVLATHGLLVSLYHFKSQRKPNVLILKLRYLQMCDIFDSTNEWLLRAADNYFRTAKMRQVLFGSVPAKAETSELKSAKDCDESDESCDVLEDVSSAELQALEKHFNHMKRVLLISE